jgi:hypothetical protein
MYEMWVRQSLIFDQRSMWLIKIIQTPNLQTILLIFPDTILKSLIKLKGLESSQIIISRTDRYRI